MPEEYIMSSKACIYVLGGAANTAALFDFDGVYILDGGFAEKNPGFVAHVRDVSAVLLAAPTLGNLGTTSALLEQGKPLPVFTNTKPFKTAKPGSSGEIAKAIQEANSKILSVAPPLFNPKYPANIIYQSAAKGVLSLYILAGDVKDAEVITKALAGGNEAEVEKAAAEHGTIGVLLWRPAMTDQSVVRVLISGTSSLSRIQQSLDKAAKSLPFLNVPTVKSKDALSDIPAPAVPRPVAGKPSARPATTTGTATRPTRPAVPAASAPRALTSRAPAGPSRPTTTRNAAPAPRTAVPSRATVLTKTAPASKAPTRAPVPARSAPAPPRGAPAKPAANTAKAEPIAQKKTVGKVQGTAPSKPAPAAPASAATSPAPAPEAPRRDPNNVTIVLDDSLSPEDFNQGSAPMDIVVIPPTPEPPRHEVAQATHPEESIIDAEDLAKAPLEVDDVANLADVEDEIPPPVDAFKKPEPHPEPNVSGGSEEDKIPEPVDAFKKPDPVELDDFDPLKPSHPEPSAPVVPSDHIIIATPDPELPDIVAAVPFVSPSPKGPNDGLVKLDDELEKIAPGFEEPLIPQAPRDDGTLAECSEEVSKLVEISMDTDNSAEVAADLAKAVGEVTQLSADLQNLGLDEKTDEYVRKLSNQMIEDATLPFTSALASSIVTSNGSETNGHGEQAHAAQNGGIDHQKEIPKHDLMQSRSSVIENGAAVQYEKTDPALDDVLNACAQESEKIDASHPDNLHMPAAPGSAAPAKPVKFARPYYFDVVTVPRNEKLETSVAADGLQEFISKVRSRNVILASKDISGEQLQAILCGKQTWCDTHPCNVIPTHSSPMLLDFRQKNEEQFAANNLQFSIPVEKQRTTVSSDAGAIEYELARVDLL
ncbi:Microtubule-associated protein homolog maph-1.1 [Caenorhabditis elegans]|uniref:Isoform c of Microtubule-associated protein homolog maph-1.1 n=1 Tax=Caenorhabditis elegans TaxID=6239 RepID=P91859-3|nr:Microtubule-associated protein homolog maph-1.1 [Caenorhabditis elegans]CAD92391.1 Microtubule-associated protein homolog maph-1.1 [Caenorhabditis elegans]|eukprot:NP_001021438.1 Microtubule-associated protein homolog maph-1.1 [Caenorhabditis elegans]